MAIRRDVAPAEIVAENHDEIGTWVGRRMRERSRARQDDEKTKQKIHIEARVGTGTCVRRFAFSHICASTNDDGGAPMGKRRPSVDDLNPRRKAGSKRRLAMNAKSEASALWRRLDTVGTDAARLFRNSTGWRLEGTAVFLHEKAPARLDYELDLNVDWTTARGVVRGFLGGNAVDQNFVRDDTAGWSMNGKNLPGFEHLKDLDLGFTPATNLQYLRRANLDVGEKIDRAVAWWEPGTDKLVDLPQRYHRRSELTYWYESPQGGYEAMLEFAPSGFARSYPGLWVLESE